MPHRLLAYFLAAVLAPGIAPGLAQAHAILEDSNPPAGATIHPGLLDVVLRYNSRIDQTRSRLLLLRADHTQHPIPIKPDPRPDILLCHLDLTQGSYIIRWQVLAVDGHITRGDVPLTVVGP